MKNHLMPLTLAIALLLSGCVSSLEREYIVKTPNVPQNAGDLAQDEVSVSSKQDVKNAVIQMAYSGIIRKDISAVNYAGNFRADLRELLTEILAEPIMGYAVAGVVPYETISAASITIVYKKDIVDLTTIKRAATAEIFYSAMSEALNEYKTKVVLDIPYYTADKYNVEDTLHLIYRDNPQASVVFPEISIRQYPESGNHRIFEIDLYYKAPHQELVAKAEKMRQQADELADKCPENLFLPEQKALWLYEELRDSVKWDADAEGNNADSHTAYGALVEGNAVSGGYAMAFKLLCRRFDIESMVIQGKKGTEEYAWNLVRLGESWYHVDIAGDVLNGDIIGFLESDKAMQKNYTWSRADYPAAKNGTLTYDLINDGIGT